MMGLVEAMERLRRASGASRASPHPGVWAPQMPVAPTSSESGGIGGAWGNIAAIAPALFNRGGSTPQGAPAASVQPSGIVADSEPVTISAPSGSSSSAPRSGGGRQGFMETMKRGLGNIDARTWVDMIGSFAAPDSIIGQGARGVGAALDSQTQRRTQEREALRKAERELAVDDFLANADEEFLSPELAEVLSNMDEGEAMEFVAKMVERKQEAEIRRAEADYVSPYQRRQDELKNDRDERTVRARERSAARAGGGRGGGGSNNVPDGWEAF